MNIKTSILWIFPLLVSSVFPQDNAELFTQATAYYNRGEYAKAIANYEQILENGEHSAALYYNLGNCYYRRSAVGPSIYYYEKALLLDPNDDEIRNNLQYAQNMRLDTIETLPKTGLIQFYEGVVHFLSRDQWAYWAVIWMVLFIVAYWVYFLLRVTYQKRILFIISISCLMLSLASITMAYIQYREAQLENPAIIFSREVTVSFEPNIQSETAFTLHEGTKVNVVDQLEGWSKIALVSGQTGWLNNNHFRLLKDF